ncbi:GNAT family N-acetyltransferase [Clostridium sp. SHJSY1]|uniref:GNAT family N-acetyltransferase n=1 Tax=Clostridium sp. SHJSY1 TaxID=2942483 RepID=UPI002873F791|nr:GNAT family N-acetyltransferase [Clostridium sp. SHJSY1]MDS0528494.1 GNAT family N-acetyltransferase [Clostridium sp. SHJSY1]
MKIKFEKAVIEDAEEIIKVRNKSFYKDYVKYGGCPGYNNTKESMVNIISNTKDRWVFKIISNNEVIGNISVKDNHDSTYYLSCLCVIPEYENKGIGQDAIRFIEDKFPNATIWTLETPADKERNHYFYKKLGYRIVKEYLDGTVKVVLFEKKVC